MMFSLGDLAAFVGGRLAGDPQLEITGAATIRDAKPREITLADNSKLAAALKNSQAAAVVVDSRFQPTGIACITVDNVHASFAKIVAKFRPVREQRQVGISPQSHICPTAKIAANVAICPGVTIGSDVTIGSGCVIHSGVRILDGCRLGDDVTLFPNVVLYENTLVGNRVIIHAGTVLGAYGFGYQTVGGRHQLSAQLGNVEIGDDVEIGANTTIDRGTYGATEIGAGTKIDNLVMIAHNCRVGRHNIICSQVGIAGSTSTGDYVVMAGQVGIADHLQVGERVTLGAMSGVMNNVPSGESYAGIPATPLREQLIKQAAFTKLPEMREQLKALQRQVEALQHSAGQAGTTKQDAA